MEEEAYQNNEIETIDPAVRAEEELEHQNRFRETMNYVLPKKFKSLRCCKICGLIKDEEDFISEGCDNCKEYFENYSEDLFTAKFTGMMSLLRPDRSYIAKCLGLKTNCCVGLYAVSCSESITVSQMDICKQNDLIPMCDRLL